MAADDEQYDLDSQKSSVFNCCRNKKCATTICINCGGAFHKSCIQRNKNIEVISDTLIKCCKTNLFLSGCNQEKLDEASTIIEIEKLKIENLMLKRLLDESENKYKLLESNNKLLEENKKLLEEKVEVIKKECDSNAKKVVNKNVQEKIQNKGSYSSVTSKQMSTSQANMKQSKEGISNVSAGSKFSGNETTCLKKLETAQLNIMNDVINLGNENEEEGNFKVQTYRKASRKTFTKYYGENENNDFAIGRKVWLYLHRIKRHVSSDKIKKYISDQPKFKDADITIKELPTHESQNKCFMFGIDWNLKDEIYKPTTWPKGMAFKRFDFKKYHKYDGNSSEDF